MVRAGALGDVYHVNGSAFGQVVIRPKSGSTWRARKAEGGGCLHDYASHVVDLMNFVVGTPQRVLGAHMRSIFSKDVEDAVYATFRYPGGGSGQLETNWSDETHRKMSTTLVVYGTKGKIVADRQECRVYLRQGAEFETYAAGWNIRYITDLQAPVAFYLRGRGVLRAGRGLRRTQWRAAAPAGELLRQRVRDRPDHRRHPEGRPGQELAMERILFGDNQFFGVNHMSEEKARAQAMQFKDTAAIIEVLDVAYDSGHRRSSCARPMTVSARSRSHARGPAALPGLHLYPCMPYAHKYANSVGEVGALETIRRSAAGRGRGDAHQGARSRR